MGVLTKLLGAFLGRPTSSELIRRGVPPGRFIWSAKVRVGEASYAVRQAVKTRVGELVPTGAGWNAFLIDVDIEPDGGEWLRGGTVLLDPRNRDFTPFEIPLEATVHSVNCPADEATTTRMTAGTRLEYLGMYPDQVDGLEGYLFRILDGAFADALVFLGTGGRHGPACWAVESTIVPGGVVQLSDEGLRHDLLPLMQAVAMEHGAPGYTRVGA